MNPRTGMGAPPADPVRVVRSLFGVATFAFLALGVLIPSSRGELWAASALLGIVWWLFDILVDHVLRPLGEWLFGGMQQRFPDGRLSVEDTIRLLESRVARGSGSERAQIRAALSLARFYEFHRKDPERASELRQMVRERFPSAPEVRYLSGPDEQE